MIMTREPSKVHVICNISLLKLINVVFSPSTVPSDPVQNVMVTNITDDTITVIISWDPPSDPNGFIQYYRVEFQLIPDNSTGCEVAPLASEVMNKFITLVEPVKHLHHC